MKVKGSMKSLTTFGQVLSKSTYTGDNAYFLEGLDGECLGWGPVNDRFLKHYLMK
jgi:hypothetical protein